MSVRASNSEQSSIYPYASSPFDNPKADLILRSCDGVDFRAFQSILAVSSDVFAGMFEAGQSIKEEVRNSCPVVRLQEDSKTMDGLLRIIYPRKAPVLGDLQRLDTILAAALKYDMEKAIDVAETALRSFVFKEPLRVWVIAVRNRLEAAARVAADELLNRQGISVLDSSPSELQDIHAGAYYRLLRCRRLNGAVEEDCTFCDPSSGQRDNPSLPSSSAGERYIISPSHDRIQHCADIICRSSDGQDFAVHKLLLMLASPVLAGLISSLPVNEVGTIAERLPVLSLDEDGTTLRTILGLCYPLVDVDNVARDAQVLRKVFDAMQKYQVEDVQKVIQVQWTNLSASDPLLALLFALRHKADTHARRAARLLLDRQIDDYYIPSLEASPAPKYRAIVQYHHLCKRALKEVVQVLRKTDAALPIKYAACQRYRAGQLYFDECGGHTAYRSITCGGISSASEGGCEPCVKVQNIIAGVTRRLEAEPDALLTALELRNETPSPSRNLPCIQCSPLRDQESLSAFYAALQMQACDAINKAYAGHIATIA